MSFLVDLFADMPDFQEALCAQVDGELFFPEKGGSTRDAKRICQSCRDQADCLDYALTSRQRFGIWGGASERERRRLAHDRGLDWSEAAPDIDHGLPVSASAPINMTAAQRRRRDLNDAEGSAA